MFGSDKNLKAYVAMLEFIDRTTDKKAMAARLKGMSKDEMHSLALSLTRMIELNAGKTAVSQLVQLHKSLQRGQIGGMTVGTPYASVSGQPRDLAAAGMIYKALRQTFTALSYASGMSLKAEDVPVLDHTKMASLCRTMEDGLVRAGKSLPP